MEYWTILMIGTAAIIMLVSAFGLWGMWNNNQVDKYEKKQDFQNQPQMPNITAPVV